MEIQDLIREKVIAEMLAERDKIIIDLYMENQQLVARIESLEKPKKRARKQKDGDL